MVQYIPLLDSNVYSYYHYDHQSLIYLLTFLLPYLLLSSKLIPDFKASLIRPSSHSRSSGKHPICIFTPHAVP